MSKKWITLIGLSILMCNPIGIFAEVNDIEITQLNQHYVITEVSNHMMLSRDGSKSTRVYTGDIISGSGDYTLFMKDKREVVRFTLSETESGLISSDEELMEQLYCGMSEDKSVIELEFTEDYMNTVDVVGKIKEYLPELSDTYPMVDYAGGSLSTRGNKVTYTPKSGRLSQEEFVVSTTSAKEEMDRFLDSLDMTKSDIELELEIIEWLIARVNYYSGGNDIPSDSTVHSVQGLYYGDELVCDGYAKTLMYMLNSIGIPTQLIKGYVESGFHAWNIVQLGDEYYHVDVTWADNDSYSVKFRSYINEKDNFMRTSHKWEEIAYPECVANTYFNLNLYEFVNSSLVGYEKSKPILVNSSEVKDTHSRLSKKLKTGYTYYEFEKYGKSVILLK